MTAQQHITVQVPKAMAEELTEIARERERPRSAEIRLALRAHIARVREEMAAEELEERAA